MLHASRGTRRKWARLIDGLDVGSPITIETLRRAVEHRTSRSLRILQADFDGAGSAPCGMWVATEQSDYILVDKTARDAQYRQTVGHEFGHILLGHTPKPTGELTNMVEFLEMFQDVPHELVLGALGGAGTLSSALGRTTYGDRIEKEAEEFGAFVSLLIDRDVIREKEPPFLSSLRDSLGTRTF